MRESARSIFLAEARKISRPWLAPTRARAGPAAPFDSLRTVPRTVFIALSLLRSLAGDEGIEPPTAVLETAVMPLN